MSRRTIIYLALAAVLLALGCGWLLIDRQATEPQPEQQEVSTASQVASEEVATVSEAADEVISLPTIAELDTITQAPLVPETDQVFGADDDSPHVSYGIALIHLQSGNLRGAIKHLKKVSTDYSSVGWYGLGNLMLTYTYHQAKEYDLAIQHGQDFLAMNPGYVDADYIQYLIASSYYKMVGSVEESGENIELAQFAFQELINSYPESKYLDEAKAKLNELASFKVEKMMSIGRWYQKRKEHVAALVLFMRIVNDHPEVVQHPEALFRAGEILYTMGSDEQMKKIFAQLANNYLDTTWHEKAKKLQGDDEATQGSDSEE